MTREEVLNNIRASYSRYGLSDDDILHEIESGEAQGFSYQTIYTGLRMALGRAYNVEELFTPAEVAEALGVTTEEIIAEIEAQRQQAIDEGRDADEVAYKTEPNEIHRFIIPAGFFR